MKTETKHTQGPWTFSIEEQGRCVVRSQTTGLPYVGQVLSINARLIASAPDLLAALREIESKLTGLLCERVLDSTLPEFYEVRNARNSARAAIATVEGNA